MADFDEAFGQDVVQEAAQELDAIEGESARAIAADLAPAQGDAGIVDAQDALVGDGDLEDVGCEVLDAGFCIGD